MENRLSVDKELQKGYLRQVEEQSGLRKEEIARLLGICSRSYRDWKRGKFTMTNYAVDLIQNHFKILLPVDKVTAERRWLEDRQKRSRLGAIARYKKYGEFATLEGRRRGGLRALEICRAKGSIPPAREFSFPGIDSNLAEFVGIVLGDGGITKSQIGITLNSEADREYVCYVADLIERLFKYKASCYPKKGAKAVVVLCNGVRLVEFVVTLGLKIGNKVAQQVDVPEWIMDRLVYSIPCVRGLMDTDGGIFVHKYCVKGKEYKYLKLNFSNRSVPLLKFVVKVLSQIGLTPKERFEGKNKQVWLYNQDEVLEYLRIVGTHNRRLLIHLEESDSLVHSGSLLNS